MWLAFDFILDSRFRQKNCGQLIYPDTIKNNNKQ